MIEVNESKLLDLIINALWAMSEDPCWVYPNTKRYLKDSMLKDNILGLSEREMNKLKSAVKEKLEELKTQYETFGED